MSFNSDVCRHRCARDHCCCYCANCPTAQSVASGTIGSGEAGHSNNILHLLVRFEQLQAGHDNYLERLAAYADAEREWEDLRLCCLSGAPSLLRSSAAIFGKQPCSQGCCSISAAVALLSEAYSNMGSRKLLRPCACI